MIFHSIVNPIQWSAARADIIISINTNCTISIKIMYKELQKGLHAISSKAHTHVLNLKPRESKASEDKALHKHVTNQLQPEAT